MSKQRQTYLFTLTVGLIIDAFLSIILILMLQYYKAKGLQFQYTDVFYFCILFIPAYFYFYKEHQRILLRSTLSYTLRSPDHPKRHIMKFLALKFCLLGVIFAVSDPVFGEEERAIPIQKGDVMVCLDLSRSMQFFNPLQRFLLSRGILLTFTGGCKCLQNVDNMSSDL